MPNSKKTNSKGQAIESKTEKAASHKTAAEVKDSKNTAKKQ
jgi:hypothetical protein